MTKGKTIKKTPEKKVDFFNGVKATMSTSKSDILEALRTACNSTGAAVGTNELAMLLTDQGTPTTGDQVRKTLQKVRKTYGAEKRAREGKVAIGSETLEWVDARDPRGVLYALYA